MTLAAPKTIYEDDLTVDTTAGGKTLSQLGVSANVLNQADILHLTTSAAIYYTYGGATPTTTLGHIVVANGELLLRGRDNIKALKIISAAGSATLFATISKI